jgi:hypothetical protein
MSKAGCKVLADMKRRIDNGEDPNTVIPYSVECADEEDYIELLYFAKQVLPEGPRKEFICDRLYEVELNAGR